MTVRLNLDELAELNFRFVATASSSTDSDHSTQPTNGAAPMNTDTQPEPDTSDTTPSATCAAVGPKGLPCSKEPNHITHSELITESEIHRAADKTVWWTEYDMAFGPNYYDPTEARRSLQNTDQASECHPDAQNAANRYPASANTHSASPTTNPYAPKPSVTSWARHSDTAASHAAAKTGFGSKNYEEVMFTILERDGGWMSALDIEDAMYPAPVTFHTNAQRHEAFVVSNKIQDVMRRAYLGWPDKDTGIPTRSAVVDRRKTSGTYEYAYRPILLGATIDRAIDLQIARQRKGGSQ